MTTKIYASGRAMVRAFLTATMLAHQVAVLPLAQYDRVPTGGNAGVRPFDQGKAAAFLGSGSDPTYFGDRQKANA